MSQLAQLAQTLNRLAGERQTAPEDVLKAATERGDAFERVVEELDAHRRRAVADARECADVFAAAQRLKEATDARAVAFRASLADVVEARCRAVEAEYDAQIGARPAEVEALRREKAGKVAELRSLLVFDAVGTPDKGDSSFLMQCTRQLTEWAGKTSATVVYDSVVDEFTEDGLFNKVKGKLNIAVVGFTTDGDVFGGFYSVAVTDQRAWFCDPTIFAFSFESRGRCETPQRFVLKEWLDKKEHGQCTTPQRFGKKEVKKKKPHVVFLKKDSSGFVWFCGGGGGFWMGNEHSHTYCRNLSGGFAGLEDTTLTGKTHQNNGPYHHCARLVVVQMSW